MYSRFTRPKASWTARQSSFPLILQTLWAMPSGETKSYRQGSFLHRSVISRIFRAAR